jgi:hypothetical protein
MSKKSYPRIQYNYKVKSVDYQSSGWDHRSQRKCSPLKVVEVCVNLPHSVFFGLFLGKTVEEALQNPRGSYSRGKYLDEHNMLVKSSSRLALPHRCNGYRGDHGDCTLIPVRNCYFFA